MSKSIIGPTVPPQPLDRTRSGRGARAGEELTHGFLCFQLAGEDFGVDLHLIKQIVKPPALTWVPRVERHILGVIAVRGEVITLVDTRLLMDFAPTSWPRDARVLLVDHAGESIGLLVDAVTQVQRLGESVLERTDALAESAGADRVLFIARPVEDRQLTIIDLVGLLAEWM